MVRCQYLCLQIRWWNRVYLWFRLSKWDDFDDFSNHFWQQHTSKFNQPWILNKFSMSKYVTRSVKSKVLLSYNYKYCLKVHTFSQGPLKLTWALLLCVGPPGPPGELPLLPPDILFQRDSPVSSASSFTRSKREVRGDIDTSKLNAGQVYNVWSSSFSTHLMLTLLRRHWFGWCWHFFFGVGDRWIVKKHRPKK